ncbi:MAG: cell wall hydrolase [Clostridia bacterium]|nr:cell wall hydrolase [Clostridia bacterium]MBQ9774357.1 cell wall hydrolase [Clostridia bacterium]
MSLVKNQSMADGRGRSVWMRALCILLMTVAIGGVLAIGASAQGKTLPADSTPTAVYLDGAEVLAGDCVIWNSITYVPLRKFCNLFDGCEFAWNGSTGTATVTTEHGMTLIVQQGALYIVANGHYFYTVGRIQNWGGSLYVPIRPLARAFDSALNWNASARRVELAAPAGAPAVAPAAYDSDDLYWLSRIISAEARGESLEGQIAVGNVVLNRVRHESYPNTVYGVIFDRKHGTQFSPVSFGTIYNKPTASAVIAAKICLEGYTMSDSILFFMNPRIATTNWISKNRPYAFTIGNHSFYE